MSAFSRLRRRFSNKPNVIQTRQGTQRLTFESLHPHWIVGRGLCMYRSEDFSNVPRNKRRDALDLQLPIWSPFARTSHHCVWEGGRVMVWFWDADAIQRDGLDGSADAATGDSSFGTSLRVRPETVFLPRVSDGVALQECCEGFELQHWNNRVLERSYWFRQRPDDSHVENVLTQWGTDAEPRLAGPAAAQAAAEGATREPWSSAPTLREWLGSNERALATAALMVLILTATWHEARYWQARSYHLAAEDQFAALQRDLDPILSARNELLALRARNLVLSEILREPSQAYLMGLVDGAIPSPDARFRQWTYQQGELSVVMVDENADPIAYVRAFEAVPIFEQVAAEQGRRANEIQITLAVRP